MSFEVTADAYDRFMGRYSSHLSPALADLTGVTKGDTVIDVGCGPGALTEVLVERLGPEAVAAVDPSAPFVEAVRERYPGVDVRQASAEELPFGDDTFDASLAQLVVHFMADPAQGVEEMARVTRPGGKVVACVWDFGGDRAPISTFWRAARELDPDAGGESGLAGAREGHLVELFRSAGLKDIVGTEIAASSRFETFEGWWEPFTLGVGPAGSYARSLDPEALDAIRDRCRELLPNPPFTVTAAAWATRGAA